jgi:putative CocE/NonD family hydrolase
MKSIIILLLFVTALPVYAEVPVQVDINVMVPMRDGVGLATNIARPAGEGKYPAILVRTPYGKENPKDAENQAIAAQGYVYIFQDCRGTGDSEGEWHPLVNERKDGLDTHAWVAAQPWCNGIIGTAGGSYVGFTQWILGPVAPETYKAMFTIVPLMDRYHDISYIGGAFGLGTSMSWGSEMLEPTKGEGAGMDYENWDWDKAYRQLPLNTWDDVLGREVSWMREWTAHPTYDAFWKEPGVLERWNEFTVPNVTISGWYDIFVGQAFNQIPVVRSEAKTAVARENQHLIVGPWGHGAGWPVGERDFGDDTGYDIGDLRQRWFAKWLKGEDVDIDLPPYRLFVMGTNEWRDEQEWPLARTQFTPYYFDSTGAAGTSNDGALSTTTPSTGPTDTYVYDPENPVPTIGGAVLFDAPGGPQDQRPLEARDDVLVYTSEPLTEAMEVTGPVKVILYAASTAPDTDWMAKLVDVAPDGTAYNLCDGILRARYRESFTDPTLIEPGEVYRYEIDLWATSNVFLPGHRIRVDITSSNFPRVDRNPNTGHPFGVDAELEKATQSIYHDGDRASHIVLPVIPAG